MMRAVLLALLLMPALAFATDVQGTISSSTVWTRSGSPYVLKGDVTVAWGTKLTLEPGVQVIAAPGDALKSGVDSQRVELIVDGTLVVRGTSASPVELTSHGGSGAWYGIRVRGGRGTEINGAVITQAHQGISLGMSATVKNTSVSAATKDCIHVSWGTATLADNELSGCGQGQPETPRMAAPQSPPPSEPSIRDRRVLTEASPRLRDENLSIPTPLAERMPVTAPAVPVSSTGEASARVTTVQPAAETIDSFRQRPSRLPVPPNRAPETPPPDETLRAMRAPDRAAPPRPPPKTGGSAADPPAREECARVPQVDESPECPGVRRWRQEQERLEKALSGVSSLPPGPRPRHLERWILTAPG
ncbi:hypothetical protein [Archangium lansingense]|uniref:FecR family protein n=1 Tax=Archangium lansingense TaxID=2995310 RepID=A0ABT4A4W6_9BACT|nr:hypothetical protein [Archangium lansinium]MCY1076696.1 hypothetical protein [Archangium lansinium]